MNFDEFKSGGSKKNLLLLTFAALAILTAISINLFFLDVPIVEDGLPLFETVYLYRTTLIIMSSWMIVVFIGNLSNDGRDPDRSNASVWEDWGVLSWSRVQPAYRIIHSTPLKRLIVWMVLLLSILFLIIFLLKPKIFHLLSKEDSLIETLSALLYLIGSGVFLRTFFYFRKAPGQNYFYLSVALVFSFLFFLIGMEEISWFQRIFSFETPYYLEKNMQDEFNLHNFATDSFENVYYFSAFIFLIILPFVNDVTSLFKRHEWLSYFIPSKFLIFVGAIPIAYNYDMWNIIFTQLSFFITLFILIHYIRWYTGSDDNSILFPILLVVYFLTQVLFIMYGSAFIRIWDVTEYKEFFIPLSYVFYSVEIMGRVRKGIIH
jgi:hypothetical protein